MFQTDISKTAIATVLEARANWFHSTGSTSSFMRFAMSGTLPTPSTYVLASRALNIADFPQDAGLNSGIYLANINLDLTKTFSKPDANPDIILKDVLLSFSFAAAASAALIPVIGPGLDVAAASIAIGSSAIGTAGGFLGNAIAGCVLLSAFSSLLIDQDRVTL